MDTKVSLIRYTVFSRFDSKFRILETNTTHTQNTNNKTKQKITQQILFSTDLGFLIQKNWKPVRSCAIKVKPRFRIALGVCVGGGGGGLWRNGLLHLLSMHEAWE